MSVFSSDNLVYKKKKKEIARAGIERATTRVATRDYIDHFNHLATKAYRVKA